jgi:hypothetical protein
MELYAKRRGREPKLIGKVPDQSGMYELPDGTTIKVDSSKIHPDYQSIKDGRPVWPLGLTTYPTREAEPTESPHIQRMRGGVIVDLTSAGEGRYKASIVHRVIAVLDKPIWSRTPMSEETGWKSSVNEVYYPDYPEISKSVQEDAPEVSGLLIPDQDALAQVRKQLAEAAEQDPYSWIDQLTYQEVRNLLPLSNRLGRTRGWKIADRLVNRYHQLLQDRQNEWERNHPYGNHI